MKTVTATVTGAEALDGNDRAAQSGSRAPVAGGLSYQGAAGGAPIARRLVSSGPTGNGNGNGPATVTDDDGGGVALNRERNAGGWYVGPGRPGVDRACDHCGRVYQARRSSSRFCSSMCRAGAWHAARENGTYGNGTHGDGLPAGGPEAQ